MRIFIAIHYLEIGGVETSLINLLLALDPNRVEVDLLVYDPRGEMMELIPDWVHQIKAPKAYHYIERPLKETLLTGAFKVDTSQLLSVLTTLQPFKPSKRIRITCNSNIATL